MMMSCNDKWVFSYEFIKEEYETYAISIDINNFIGKCAYGDDVLLELTKEGYIIYSDTYSHDNTEFIDSDQISEFDFDKLKDNSYIDLILVKVQ